MRLKMIPITQSRGRSLSLERTPAWVLLTLLTVLPSCKQTVDKEPPPFVSLIELVSRPKDYHGKNVHVAGFLSLDFEGKSLYLHREDYAFRLLRNGVWLEIAQLDLQSAKTNNLDKGYVVVEGRFDSEDRGHRDMWSGAIKEIKSITGIPPRKNVQELPEDLAK